MELGDLISANDVLPAMRAQSKRQVLQTLAEQAASRTGLTSRAIFDTLLQRERLGSTAVGSGVAIPHGKLQGLPGITGLFARLDQPIDFEALDDQPVDLVFLLLAPERAGADHLKALAWISRVMRDSERVRRLRDTRDPGVLYALLTEGQTTHAA